MPRMIRHISTNLAAMLVLHITPGHRWTISTSGIIRTRVMVLDTAMIMAIAAGGLSDSAMHTHHGTTRPIIMTITRPGMRRTITTIILPGGLTMVITTVVIAMETKGITKITTITVMLAMVVAMATVDMETGPASIQMMSGAPRVAIAAMLILEAEKQHR